MTTPPHKSTPSATHLTTRPQHHLIIPGRVNSHPPPAPPLPQPPRPQRAAVGVGSGHTGQIHSSFPCRSLSVIGFTFEWGACGLPQALEIWVGSSMGRGAVHLGVQSGAIGVVARKVTCPTHREGTRTCTEHTNGLGHCTEHTTPKSTPRATASWYWPNTLVASRWPVHRKPQTGNH